MRRAVPSRGAAGAKTGKTEPGVGEGRTGPRGRAEVKGPAHSSGATVHSEIKERGNNPGKRGPAQGCAWAQHR